MSMHTFPPIFPYGWTGQPQPQDVPSIWLTTPQIISQNANHESSVEIPILFGAKITIFTIKLPLPTCHQI